MDAKITKKRLGHLLSYDWLKIVGICAIAVVLWLLVFTTAATRASSGQVFDIYYYTGVSYDEGAIDDLDRLKSRGALSYDILSLVNYQIPSSSMASTIFPARFAAGEGDMLVAIDGGGAQDENGRYTSLQGLKEFLYSYRGNCLWLDPEGGGYSEGEDGVSCDNYFTLCEQYLSRFFFSESGESDWRYGTLDETVARANFDERMDGDKRYRSDEARDAAFEEEKARLENLRTAYVYVKDEVMKEDGVIQIKTLSFTYYNGTAETTFDWKFAFDLSGIANITEVFRSSGDDARSGLSMCILNTGSYQDPDLRFEQFTLLHYLATNYS